MDRWPLFAFAIVYGFARIVSVAVLEPGGRRPARVLAGSLGAALFLAACLHPTFGGLVLRPAFMTGSMSFLGSAPVQAVLAGATAAGALVFALALGLGTMLARLRPDRTWRGLRRAVLSFVAIWWGALVLAAPRAFDLAVGYWPLWPLTLGQVATTMAVLAAAFAPHALVHAFREPPRP